MAFIEYILVALLGSGAAAPAGTPGGASTPIFNADSIAQPNGGVAGDYSQKKPVKEARQDSGKKATMETSSRHHHRRRHHRHRRSLESGKKATKQ